MPTKKRRSSTSHAAVKKSTTRRTPVRKKRAPKPAEPAEGFGVMPPKTYFGSHTGGFRPPISADTALAPAQQPSVQPSVVPELPRTPPPRPAGFPWRAVLARAALPAAAVAVLGGSYALGVLATQAVLGSPSAGGGIRLADSPLKLGGFEDCVARGFPIEDDGEIRRCHAPDGQVLVQAPADMAALAAEDPRLLVTRPVAGEAVRSRVQVRGFARLYEHPITVRLIQDGVAVTDAEVFTEPPARGDYGAFQVTLALPEDGPDAFLIELTGTRDEDAVPLEPVRIPVRRSR